MIFRPIQIDNLILPSGTKINSTQNEAEGFVQYAVKDGAFPYSKKTRLEAKNINLTGYFQEEVFCKTNCVKYTKTEFGQKIQSLNQKTTFLYAIRHDNKIFRIPIRISIPIFNEEKYGCDGFGFTIPMIATDPYWSDVSDYLYLDNGCGFCPCEEPTPYLIDSGFCNFGQTCYPLKVLDYPFVKRPVKELVIKPFYTPPIDKINPQIGYVLNGQDNEAFYLDPDFALNSNQNSIIGNFTFSDQSFVNPTSIVLNGNNTLQTLDILVNRIDLSTHSDGTNTTPLDELSFLLQVTNFANLLQLDLEIFDSAGNSIKVENLQNSAFINNTFQNQQINFRQFSNIDNFDLSDINKIILSYRGLTDLIFNGILLNKTFGYGLEQVLDDSALIKSKYTLADTEIIAFFNPTSITKILSFEGLTITVPENYSMVVIANGKYYFGNSFFSLQEKGLCINRFNRENLSVAYQSEKTASIFWRQIELYL